MAYKEFELTKLYYSISEVAKLLNVSTSLIRFWETEFDILKPKKNRQGNRLFTEEDIKNLKVIYNLVRERGFTLEGAKKKLKESKETTVRNTEVVDSLKKLRAFLVEVKQSLEVGGPVVEEGPAVEVAEAPATEVAEAPVAEVTKAPVAEAADTNTPELRFTLEVRDSLEEGNSSEAESSLEGK